MSAPTVYPAMLFSKSHPNTSAFARTKSKAGLALLVAPVISATMRLVDQLDNMHRS
jgi:hypothetical protein